jgi:hypothetical protein
MIKTTPIAYSVHREGDNPIFGESSTHVVIEDESAGPFIVLKQCHDHIKEGEVRFDLEELEAILIIARTMIVEQPPTVPKDELPVDF